jgi:hypothetical protein
MTLGRPKLTIDDILLVIFRIEMVLVDLPLNGHADLCHGRLGLAKDLVT